MLQPFKSNSSVIIQQAIFRPRSAVIIATSLILAFVFSGYWWAVLGIGLIIWLISAWETIRNPHIQALAQTIEKEFEAQELIEELENWFKTLQKAKVPADILTKVESIKNSIRDILPQIENLNSSDYNVYAIRQIAQSYLPETLANYLKLPPNFAKQKVIKDNQTAHQILLQQLDLLDEEMKEMLDSFYQNDTQRLLAHGRFLQEKFGNSDLLDLN
jgi:HPt (histidine-containing phosphotransfer) domain-containing protein